MSESLFTKKCLEGFDPSCMCFFHLLIFHDFKVFSSFSLCFDMFFVGSSAKRVTGGASFSREPTVHHLGFPDLRSGRSTLVFGDRCHVSSEPRNIYQIPGTPKPTSFLHGCLDVGLFSKHFPYELI